MRVKDVMTRAVATCQPFDKLLDAAGILQREDVGCLPVVTDDGSERVLGLLTDRDVTIAGGRERRGIADLHVRNAMSRAVLSRAVNGSLLEALSFMRSMQARRLPIVDRDGSLIGLLSLSDIARKVAGEKQTAAALCRAEICRILAASARAGKRSAGQGGRAAAVDEVMVKDVVVCRSDENLGVVARRMDAEGVPCTPVLEAGSGRRVVAVLTDRDVCLTAVRRGRPLEEIPVAAAMSPALRSCWPDDSPEAAAAIMRAYGVRRLPVVNASFDLLGLITVGDLARTFLESDVPIDGVAPSDEIAETLAAIIHVATEQSASSRRSSGDFPRCVEL